MPEFEYTSAHELQDLIAALPVLALQAAEPAMIQTLLFLHGKIPEYPELPMLPGGHIAPDGVSFLHTEQQRKWFFTVIKKNLLPGWAWEDGHPAKTGSVRTGTLGRKATDVLNPDQAFSGAITKETDSITGEIGTNLNYAPWVVGPDFPGEQINGRMMYQAQVHVGQWWQFGTVVSANMEGAWEVFDDSFWPMFLELVKNRSGQSPSGG